MQVRWRRTRSGSGGGIRGSGGRRGPCGRACAGEGLRTRSARGGSGKVTVQ